MEEKLQEVKQFLDDHADLINSNDFETLYSTEAYRKLLRSSKTILMHILIESDINPLAEMTFIPSDFLTNMDFTSFIIPNGIEEIQTWAFYHCTKLESIDIPNTVTTIGASAFFDNISLKELNIPKSVTRIESDAFENCVNLEKVYLPNNLKYLGTSVFSGCKNLKTIYYDGTEEEWDQIRIGPSCFPKRTKIIFRS